MEQFFEIVKKIVLPTKASTRKCIAHFFKQNGNQWILSDEELAKKIVQFFYLLPETDLFNLVFRKQLLFLYCNNKMSCTFYQYKHREILLIFPDLYKLILSSKYEQAFAILAHEIGHIISQHTQKNISYSQAQIEADCYAWRLGFGESLVSVLENEAWSDEIAERVRALKTLIKI